MRKRKMLVYKVKGGVVLGSATDSKKNLVKLYVEADLGSKIQLEKQPDSKRNPNEDLLDADPHLLRVQVSNLYLTDGILDFSSTDKKVVFLQERIARAIRRISEDFWVPKYFPQLMWNDKEKASYNSPIKLNGGINLSMLGDFLKNCKIFFPEIYQVYKINFIVWGRKKPPTYLVKLYDWDNNSHLGDVDEYFLLLGNILKALFKSGFTKAEAYRIMCYGLVESGFKEELKEKNLELYNLLRVYSPKGSSEKSGELKGYLLKGGNIVTDYVTITSKGNPYYRLYAKKFKDGILPFVVCG